MHIRKATPQDLDTVFNIILDGKAALAALGIDQWQGSSPSKEMIDRDIAQGWTYLVEEDGKALSTMAYVPSGEADYDNVTAGQWLLPDLENVPADGHAEYATIHRVAAAASARGTGAGRFVIMSGVELAKQQGMRSVRIDTHEGNVVMRGLLESCGFTQCTDILLNSTTEPTRKRLGFEMVLSQAEPEAPALKLGRVKLADGRMRDIVPGAYRHFKGNLYWVEDVVKHSETQERMVLYRALYGSGGLWVRPLEMFASPVDKEKYPEVKAEFRFEKVNDALAADKLPKVVPGVSAAAEPAAGASNEAAIGLDDPEPTVEDGFTTCQVEEWKIQRALDEQFMARALELARLAAAEGEVPIGAVVVHEGQIIAEGYNRREALVDPSAHAEFHAMLAAAQELERWRLTGCTVYVTVEPCIMCAGLMHQARIDRCVYGAPDPKAGALGSLYNIQSDSRLNHNFEVTSHILNNECSQVMQDFFAARRLENGQSGRKNSHI